MDVASTLESNNHTIASFSNASVVSNSWGFYESSGVFPSMETTLETAAANGISFSFSSGDCGDNFNTCEFVGQIEVNYPSSSAFVTSIGGTSAFVDNSWNYAFETGWGTFTTQFVYGGGGGISQDYGPVTWQNSISNFTAGGYTAGTVGHYDKRALPDVAMLADPTTGLNIYEAYDGGWMVIGGTSLACPVFSATLGLVNQARALLSKSTPIGLAAPYLYNENSTLRNASALNLIIPPHQIISGATPPPGGAPLSAFTIGSTTFSWDSTLTIEPEDQFWNDVAGVGSPNIPNFVGTMANM
jgi:subtilase family serine protease